MRFSALDTVDPDIGELISTSMRASISSAEYRFTDLEDSATSYGGQLMLPFRPGSNLIEISGGYDYYEKGRGYLQNQLQFGTTSAPASAPARHARRGAHGRRPSSIRSTVMR